MADIHESATQESPVADRGGPALPGHMPTPVSSETQTAPSCLEYQVDARTKEAKHDDVECGVTKDGLEDAGACKMIAARNVQAAATKAATTIKAKVDPFRLHVILFGSYLACCAGMVNAISFYALGGFTSHVTGTFSKVGLNLEKGALEDVKHGASLLLSFLAGAVVCGCLVPRSTVSFGYSMYGLALIGNAVLLVVAFLVSSESDAAPYLVAAACGLQNGMITSYSGAVIRTTHVTGLFTDVGLILGRALAVCMHRVCAALGVRRCMSAKELTVAKICEESKKLTLLLLLAAAFLVGVVMGVVFFSAYGVDALLIPAACAGVTGVSYTVHRTCFLGRPLFDFSGPPGRPSATRLLSTFLPDGSPSQKLVRRFTETLGMPPLSLPNLTISAPPDVDASGPPRSPSHDPPLVLHTPAVLIVQGQQATTRRVEAEDVGPEAVVRGPTDGTASATLDGDAAARSREVRRALEALEAPLSELKHEGSPSMQELHSEAMLAYRRLQWVVEQAGQATLCS